MDKDFQKWLKESGAMDKLQKQFQIQRKVPFAVYELATDQLDQFFAELGDGVFDLHVRYLKGKSVIFTVKEASITPIRKKQDAISATEIRDFKTNLDKFGFKKRERDEKGL